MPKVALSHAHLTDIVSTAAAPVLQINPVEATEGDEIQLNCAAPEQPSEFYFYKNSTQIVHQKADAKQIMYTYGVNSSGNYNYHCLYNILVDGTSYSSLNSSTVTVSVKGTSVSDLHFYKE